MEQKPSSSSTKNPEKIAITPELLEAMTQQFISLQQSTNLVHKPKVYTFGNVTLRSLPLNQSFKTKSAVNEEQQVLIDYAWNARNRSQSTVAMQAFGAYFQEQNMIRKSLPVNVMQEKSLDPVMGYNKLTAALKELEVENAYLQREAIKIKELAAQVKELKQHILSEEELDIEGWGRWNRFPQKLSPQKEHILDIVLSDMMAEQISLQQLFRKLACQSKIIEGLTFVSETYEDDGASCKGFTYLTCTINLKKWKDINLEGERITLENLLKFGLVSRMILTEKSQLKLISPGCEKLTLTLAGMYEQNAKSWFEVNLQTIPPSFYPNHIDDARSIITIKQVEHIRQQYSVIPEIEMIPEDKVDILDQINMYRAMVYRKPYVPETHMKLISEERNAKIYGPQYLNNMFIRSSFSGQTTEFPAEVIYFSKVKAYQLTKLSGDLFITSDSTDDEEVGSAHLSDAVDSIGMQNLDNAMET